MRVYGIYHGGYGYGGMFTNQDVERFDSIGNAKSVFEARGDFDPYYPCTDESASMWLFFEDPTGDGDPKDFLDPGYPDMIIDFGPRGGVRCYGA